MIVYQIYYNKGKKMKAFISKDFYESHCQLHRNLINRTIYHRPNIGRYGGWAIALISQAERSLIVVAGIIENIFLLLINSAGSCCSPQCKKDLKENKITLKLFFQSAAATPCTVIRNIIALTQRAQEFENRKAQDHWTPSHFAAAYNDTSLMASQAAINRANLISNRPGVPTPLHLAVNNQNPEIISLILQQHPQELFAITERNLTCLEKALQSGHQPTIDAFKPFINQKNGRGLTSLMLAAQKNNQALVELLISNGADQSIKDGNGKNTNAYLTDCYFKSAKSIFDKK